MSYQVLARKYRPSCFTQMVGQTATLQALRNALDYKKLHHAYLLTGSRGIGKTSLARLLAKCLNCAKGVSANPCDNCDTCQAIRNNRFIDLIEIDAASRTRVEDIQGLLENVQYKPVIGRFKVYLIDEVHMLSIHSFNALLKTLEEPPEHIIFVLATTDAQRLPATILSRCLQFHLKNLSVAQITQQLSNILQQEKIIYEKQALEQISTAAKGSLRDALSLLEQIILYGDIQQVKKTDVEAILGHINQADQLALISAIYNKEVNTLLTIINRLAETGIDFEQLLSNLITHFHQMSIAQLSSGSEFNIPPQILSLGKKLGAETIQLYYQIALIGQRDLPLAPTPQIGVEITLLRMLAFYPETTPPVAPQKNQFVNSMNLTQVPEKNIFEATKTSLPLENESCFVKSETVSSDQLEQLNWPQLVKQLPLTGFLKSLALHCNLTNYEGKNMYFKLDPSQGVLYSKDREALLEKIVSQYFNQDIKLHIQLGEVDIVTPAGLEAEKLNQDYKMAHASILKNPIVNSIIDRFDATVRPNSIIMKTGDIHE